MAGFYIVLRFNPGRTIKYKFVIIKPNYFDLAFILLNIIIQLDRLLILNVDFIFFIIFDVLDQRLLEMHIEDLKNTWFNLTFKPYIKTLILRMHQP